MTSGESTIFGDRAFGFELASIAEARQSAAENARDHEQMLTDEDDRLREVAERDRERYQQETAFFGAHDDETILGGLRYVFDRGRQLEASGLSELEVAATMSAEIPDLAIIGGTLLERQSWGYLLNQMSVAAALMPGDS